MAQSPAHYNRGSIEVWDFIRDQKLNYHLGNVIKYTCRAGHKNPNTKEEDLKKAIHYLENELRHTPPSPVGGPLHSDLAKRPSDPVPDSIWINEWDWETDYATGFDR